MHKKPQAARNAKEEAEEADKASYTLEPRAEAKTSIEAKAHLVCSPTQNGIGPQVLAVEAWCNCAAQEQKRARRRLTRGLTCSQEPAAHLLHMPAC